MAAAGAGAINIRDHVYEPGKPKDLDKTWVDYLVGYNKEAAGAFRVVQCFERVCKLAAMVFEEMSSALLDFAAKCATTMGLLNIIRLPKVLSDSYDALTTFGDVKGPEGHPFRATANRLHTLFDAAAACCYAGFMLLSNLVLKHAGEVFTFVADTINVGQAGEDYCKADELLAIVKREQPTNVDLQEQFEVTKKDALIRMAKAVFSFVCGIFALSILFFKTALVAPEVALVVSLAATVCAMWAYFYREVNTDAGRAPFEFFK